MRWFIAALLGSGVAAGFVLREHPPQTQSVDCCSFQGTAPVQPRPATFPAQPTSQPGAMTRECGQCPNGTPVVWWVEPFGVRNAYCSGCEPIFNVRRFMEFAGDCNWHPWADDGICPENGAALAAPFELRFEPARQEWRLVTVIGEPGPEWGCPAARWNCTGPNVLDLRRIDRTGACANWPAQVRLSPG